MLPCVSFNVMNVDQDSAFVHPYTTDTLYGEVNSVKNTTLNIWLNDGVY